MTIQCGVEDGRTLGTPICCTVNNEDVRKGDYSSFKDIPRPGHADYTYMLKYGIKASSGGGRASARETIGRVCAGAIAEKYLSDAFGTKFISFVESIGEISIPPEEKSTLIKELSTCTPSEVDLRSTLIIFEHNQQRLYCDYQGKIWTSDLQLIYEFGVNGHEVFRQIQQGKFQGFEFEGEVVTQMQEVVNFRCPHVETAIRMIERVKEVVEMKDSIGGVAAGVVVGAPKGIGEPCFEKYEALLAMAMLSLPATKGFEFGSGFEGTKLLGSQHNDAF